MRAAPCACYVEVNRVASFRHISVLLFSLSSTLLNLNLLSNKTANRAIKKRMTGRLAGKNAIVTGAAGYVLAYISF